ncbi:MAG: hypothetical protein H7288_23580 [Kineosporiaceae bacterium]|nr:hypothetical protein [Aeromicrobium sp.]
MSSLASPRVRSTRPATAPKRLRLVAPAHSQAGRTPFVVVVITVISLGLVGLIFMSTILQGQSFEIARLDREANSLQTQQESLVHDLDQLKSPAGLASAAVGYGMVPNTNPVFLRLSDGKVIGKSSPALPDTNVKRVER